MRHAEFSTRVAAAVQPTVATRPTQAIGGGTGFARAFSDVQTEVATFIAEGDHGATHLSAEGSMWRARSEAVVDTDAAATSPHQQAFLDSIAPWAREAGEKLGVAPELVAAHAALESGWGQRPIPGASGTGTSHNLFGIKAGAHWNGAVSDTATTEYVGGAPIATSARFRAYPDAAGAFRDYAHMLADNPRYQGALNTGSDARAFAQGLVKGGYATDPGYADKLVRLASKLQGFKG